MLHRKFKPGSVITMGVDRNGDITVSDGDVVLAPANNIVVLADHASGVDGSIRIIRGAGKGGDAPEGSDAEGRHRRVVVNATVDVSDE